MRTIGLALISQCFKEASYCYTGTSRHIINAYKTSNIARNALAFIQGSGLEATIKTYSLDLDANSLREKFNEIFRRK